MQKLSTLIIRDWVIHSTIGCGQWEKDNKQRILINIEMDVNLDPADMSDELDKTLCYEKLKNKIRDGVFHEHIQLVETAAQKISDIIMDSPQVREARVKIEKPDIFEDDGAVGFQLITKRSEIND